MQHDDEALLSISLACHGQLVKMFITYMIVMVYFHLILLSIWRGLIWTLIIRTHIKGHFAML